MVKMKEGFKGERFASLPDNLLETYSKDPLIGDLFLRKIGLEELAAHFKYSASHFSMLFQKETGSSPINYFLRLKIQKACQYIELTDLKLQDIATAIGFEEPAYFSRLFTKIMGMTPSAYRKQEKG